MRGFAERGDDGEGQDGADDEEGSFGGDGAEVFDQHFCADENEDRGEAEVEVDEAFHGAGEDGVEGAEAEDGADVGGVDDEGVAGDAEDGGDGVEGEEEVGGLDDHEDEEEESEFTATVLANEEASGVRSGAEGEVAAGEADDGHFFDIDVGSMEEHVDSGVENVAAEEVDEPGEGVEEGDARADKNAAQDEGADNAPEEDAALLRRFDAEVGKDEGEEEEVIDAEGVLDEVAGEEFDPFFGADLRGEPETEAEGEEDPDEGGENRLEEGRGALEAGKKDEVDNDEEGNGEIEADPEDERRCHGGGL